MEMHFSKYSGCGNDFIILDNRTHLFDSSNHEALRHICNRQLGIGADGIILLESSDLADFRMRIFNADASEAEMCGNGLRCLARFIHELDLKKDQFVIETMHQQLLVSVSEEIVTVSLPAAREVRLFQQLKIEEANFTVHFLDTGVPHVVIFVENVSDPHWMSVAPKIRNHPDFGPNGANVNFAAIEASGNVVLRTYERGVEAETLACGTGALAAAVIVALVHQIPDPITISPKSGEKIKITFKTPGKPLGDLVMTGPATKVYNGVFETETFRLPITQDFL